MGLDPGLVLALKHWDRAASGSQRVKKEDCPEMLLGFTFSFCGF